MPPYLETAFDRALAEARAGEPSLPIRLNLDFVGKSRHLKTAFQPRTSYQAHFGLVEDAGERDLFREEDVTDTVIPGELSVMGMGNER